MASTLSGPRPSQQGTKKLPGRPPGKAGAQARTLRLGGEVQELLDRGIPLNVLVANWRSHPSNDTEAKAVARKLRHALKAAREADGLPPPDPRSTSPASANALRRYRAHSQDHHKRYEQYEAGPARRWAPAAYWESLAILCELRCAFEHAIAEASGRAPKGWTSRQECLAAAHRARAAAIRSQG